MGTESEADKVSQRLVLVREGIAEAAAKCGRLPEDIKLIAVTKFVEKERILPAILNGITDVDENRAQ